MRREGLGRKEEERQGARKGKLKYANKIKAIEEYNMTKVYM